MVHTRIPAEGQFVAFHAFPTGPSKVTAGFQDIHLFVCVLTDITDENSTIAIPWHIVEKQKKYVVMNDVCQLEPNIRPQEGECVNKERE